MQFTKHLCIQREGAVFFMQIYGRSRNIEILKYLCTGRGQLNRQELGLDQLLLHFWKLQMSSNTLFATERVFEEPEGNIYLRQVKRCFWGAETLKAWKFTQNCWSQIHGCPKDRNFQKVAPKDPKRSFWRKKLKMYTNFPLKVRFLGLFTSCSATFWQRFNHRATFCNFWQFRAIFCNF